MHSGVTGSISLVRRPRRHRQAPDCTPTGRSLPCNIGRASRHFSRSQIAVTPTSAAAQEITLAVSAAKCSEGQRESCF